MSSSGAEDRQSGLQSIQGEILVPWFEFLDGLIGFHAALGLPEPSASKSCRLLYRFDRLGEGEIDVSSFVEHVRTTLIEFCDTNERPRSVLTFAQSETQTTAVLNSRGRPDVETFTTAKAVRKLFTARARAASHELDMASLGTIPTPSSSGLQLFSLACDQQAGDRYHLGSKHHQRNSRYCLEMALLEEGNSRLSKIHRLPVTRILR